MLLPLPFLKAASTPVTVCVSGIHAHVCYWLDLHTGRQQPRPLAWSEAPGPQGSGLGSSSWAGVSWARAAGEGSHALTSLNTLLQMRFQLAHLLIPGSSVQRTVFFTFTILVYLLHLILTLQLKSRFFFFPQ